MAQHTQLRVELLAYTDFLLPADGVDWETDAATKAEALIEFAGRACYETFDKPNPRTSTNAAYIRHIMEVGHLALLEHPTATIYVRGISRVATHELVRHRHFSFSQLSQRFTHPDGAHVVMPKIIAEDEELSRLFMRAVEQSQAAYSELYAALAAKLSEEPNAVLRHKQSVQAAHAILPQATESRIVVTGNFRTWRHFIGMRASEHADVEIRQLAVSCLELLQGVAPTVFSDFEIATLADGTKMATSPYVTDF